MGETHLRVGGRQARDGVGAYAAMTWFALVQKWFLSTAIGRWIVGIGAVLAAAAVLAFTAFMKGKHAQATTDAAKNAEAQQRAAQVAQDVQTDASAAVAKVQADAAKQPAPDPIKRDDFNDTF